jgi:tetratricopeptide (TPR) repeat protein
VNNESVDFERTPAERPVQHRITFDRTDLETKSDTIAFFITFAALYDSLPYSAMFVAQKEFILPFDRNSRWLPEVGSSAAEHLSLRFTAPANITILTQVPADTATNNGMRMWTIDGTRMPMQSVFSLSADWPMRYGQSSVSSDSSCSVTFYSSPLRRFNQQYAAATAQQLSDALQYFNAVTGRRLTTLTLYDRREHVRGNTPTLIPQLNVIRSQFAGVHCLRFRSGHPIHLQSMDHGTCPAVLSPDRRQHRAMFDDGLSAYLASRFLISRYPGTSRKERFDAVSNALTFFPSGTLAAGHSDRSNTNSIISFRGRYLFSMMEYLLGQESLDRVIMKITAGPAEPPVTFERFAALCTEEYGTPLENFIDQWVRRSASPEFVMQWKNERTVRGLSVVKASIEQRGTIFSVPIPLAFTFGSRVLIRRVRMEQQKQEFTFTFPSPPTSVELDPELNILRWQLEFRISAHAKTALLYLTVNRDIVNAEREALYTQQLDPNNSTGSAPLALFILGNISAVNGNKEKAKEYFLQSASAGATEGSDTYRLLSLIRYGNLLESDGKRDEAVTYYQRAVSEGIKDPVINAAAVTEAEMFLRERFVSDERSWFFVP